MKVKRIAMYIDIYELFSRKTVIAVNILRT